MVVGHQKAHTNYSVCVRGERRGMCARVRGEEGCVRLCEGRGGNTDSKRTTM